MTDIDKWLAEAKRPRRSVTIYQRADLQAVIDNIEQRAAVTTDPDVAAELSAEFETVKQQIVDSALTITMEAVPAGELAAIAEEAKLDGCDATGLAARQIARAVIDPALTADQIIGMADRIGQAQVAKLTAAYVLVTKAPIEPPELLE